MVYREEDYGKPQNWDQPRPPSYVQGFDPKSMSLTDYLTGKYDHSGFDQFKNEAMRKGPSSWATLAVQDQAARANDQREKGAAAANSSVAQAEDQLAARGGLSSGARERATTEGAKNYLSMAQDTGKQENLNSMQIGMNDEQARMQQLSMLPGMEGEQAKMWATAKGQDTANQLAETQRLNEYNQNLYNQQATMYGANKTANATLNANHSACCFIFLEARYGNGAMDSVVRRYRDENMTERNRRGYYKLSEVLVPLMRKSRVVKGLVRLFLTDPLVSYGKHHYGQGRLGIVFKPVVKFWVGLFDYLGGDHPFIRENGETV